jgi:alkanesulfonate monooxygenase SsuD/methylene tetrahydromethanopterin reductase-like flavin-dependent oxidoreductase (luciferase family)
VVKVGLGLPTMLAGADRSLVLEWARRADAGGLSTLSTGELLTTASYDAIVSLSAVAAVTERARLMTNVLVVPLHNAGVLAKQAATLDQLSLGRLTLGIGVGGRKPILYDLTNDPSAHANYPDYASAPAPYEGRVVRAEEQVEYMRRIWRGEPPLAGVPPVGPLPVRPGGPELLCGSFAPGAIRRAAQWADGMTSFDHGADAAKVGKDFVVARDAWASAGRIEQPRFVASFFFALGPDADKGKAAFLDSHYAHLSDEGKRRIGATIRTTTAAAIIDALRAYADVGADEVLLVPMVPTLDQVDRAIELLPLGP